MKSSQPALPPGSVSPPGTARSGERVDITVTGLRRSFGSVVALDGLDLTAPAGQVTALVGPNGSGKTTLFLVLATLLAPDRGTARIGGFDPMTDQHEVRRLIGWMPDGFGTWDSLTVREVLRTVASAYRLAPAHASRRIDDLLTMLHLTDLAETSARVLSRGQKQRLGLARALIHSPRALLLDEPASGLDPRSRIELRDILRALAADGVTILVSSHILSELEEMSDRAVVIAGGRAVAEHTLRGASRPSSTWRITSLDGERLTRALSAYGVAALPVPVPDGDWANRLAVDVEIAGEPEAAALLAALVTDEVPVYGFAPSFSGLETAYLAATQERR